MYSIDVTINHHDGRETEYTIRPDAVDTSSLEKAISSTITQYPRATSFVFVVARRP